MLIQMASLWCLISCGDLTRSCIVDDIQVTNNNMIKDRGSYSTQGGSSISSCQRYNIMKSLCNRPEARPRKGRGNNGRANTTWQSCTDEVHRHDALSPKVHPAPVWWECPTSIWERIFLWHLEPEFRQEQRELKHTTSSPNLPQSNG